MSENSGQPEVGASPSAVGGSMGEGSPAAVQSVMQVFTAEALRWFHERGEPPTAAEAWLAGPWRVVRLGPKDYGVLQLGERENHDQPLARFRESHVALLAAAALPGVGRDSSFQIDASAGDDGYRLLCDGIEVGRVSCFLAELAPALDVLTAVVRSPLAIALLLEAAGPAALERAGSLLARRLVNAPADEVD